MGCKNSKGASRIQPVGPAEIKRDNRRLRKTKSEMDAEVGNNNKNSEKVKRSKSGKSNRNGSCVSLDGDRSIEDSDRGFSASSKNSKQSDDSGLGEEYATVITEYSDPNVVQEIEEDFTERDGLDLAISGKACSVRTSAKDKERLQETMILQALREEGLIARPHGQGASGMSFDIVADTSPVKRPPPRLEKLEKRRKKKKPLTEEEIEEKLKRAERRKRKREQERLEKIKELEKTKTNDVLEAFAQMQKEKESQVYQKIDTVSDNREKRLREKQEKLKERERRAEMVRKRKQLAALEGEKPEDIGEIPRGKQLDL